MYFRALDTFDDVTKHTNSKYFYFKTTSTRLNKNVLFLYVYFTIIKYIKYTFSQTYLTALSKTHARHSILQIIKDCFVITEKKKKFRLF